MQTTWGGTNEGGQKSRYPVLPLIFCAACAWLTYSSVTYAISQKAIHVSLWLIASGILALLILRAREKTLEQLPHQI
jgi:hypothetical protein